MEEVLFSSKIIFGMQVGRTGCFPACGGNGDSRNAVKPSLHCHKHHLEGALYKWLTKRASDAMHVVLYIINELHEIHANATIHTSKFFFS